MDIEQFRREYLYGGLHRADLADHPIEQFQDWLKQAVEAGIQDPTAMTVATVDLNGCPWQRVVLLKDVNRKGFVFYTNLSSRKAQEIDASNQVSLHFPWMVLDRQVIVSGVAERLDRAQVARYFLSRPRESQLAAWASEQSRPLSARLVLEAQFKSMKNKFAKGEVPLPDFWGGYRVTPRNMEFWQGGANRLHDRFYYSRQEGDAWHIERLAP